MSTNERILSDDELERFGLSSLAPERLDPFHIGNGKTWPQEMSDRMEEVRRQRERERAEFLARINGTQTPQLLGGSGKKR